MSNIMPCVNKIGRSRTAFLAFVETLLVAGFLSWACSEKTRNSSQDGNTTPPASTDGYLVADHLTADAFDKSLLVRRW